MREQAQWPGLRVRLSSMARCCGLGGRIEVELGVGEIGVGVGRGVAVVARAAEFIANQCILFQALPQPTQNTSFPPLISNPSISR